MQSFTGVAEAARGVQEFLFDREAALPDDVREKLKALVGPTTSPVDTVVNGAELLYARRSELTAPALELAAALAMVAEQYNFHGMAQENRGSKLALILMRNANVDKPAILGEYPDEADDLAPKEQFVKVEEPAPTPAEDVPPAEGARRPVATDPTDTNKS